MDLYDPRKRLQVVNASNPSLRVAVAPAQQLSVSTNPSQPISVTTANNSNNPNKQRLFVGNQEVQQDQNAAARPLPQTQDHRNIIEKAANVISEPFKPFAEGVTRALIPGADAQQKALEKQSASDEATFKMFTDLYKQGKISSDAYQKAANEYSQGQMNVSAGVNKDAKFDRSRFLGSAAQIPIAIFGGGELAGAKGLGSVVASGVATGGAAGLANEFSSNDNPTLKGALLQSGLGATIGGALPIFGASVGKLVTALRGGEEGIVNRFVNKIAQSNDAEQIASKVSKALPDANQETVRGLASYLAEEKNPEAIRGVLNELQQGNLDGVYTALSPDPRSLPEGMVPPRQAGTPNANRTEEEMLALQKEARGEVTDTELKKIQDQALKDAGAQTDNTVPKPTPTYEEAQQLIQKEGGYSGASSLPATNKYAADELGQSLGLNPKFIYEEATKNNLDLQPFLQKFDSGESDAVTVSNEIMDALSGNKATPKELPGGVNVPQATSPEAAKIEQAVAETPSQSGTTTPSYTPGVNTSKQAGVADNVNQNADQAAQALPQKAEDILPGADDNTKAAVQKVLDELNNAQTSYDTALAARSGEKASRAAAAEKAYVDAGGGEAGMRAKFAALRGKYTESGFNPINIDEASQKAILDDIANSDLQGFQKTNTQNAIRKIWGATDKPPTAADVRYIREYFGQDFGDAVEQAVAEGGSNWREKLGQVVGTPRSIMASFDLSGTLRQGGVLGSRFPKELGSAFKEQLKYFASEKSFQEGMQEIASRPTYGSMVDHGLDIAAAEGLTNTEERFASSLAEKIPGLGRGVGASDRAYSGFLAKLRADVFDKIVTHEQAIGHELDDKALDSIAGFINTASGRGDLGKYLEQHSTTLSATLFSPRLWKSRLDLLNPVYYAKLDPVARKYALQTAGTFATEAGAILGLATLAGAQVETDARSSDFLKIKVGNTRYDILGGLQQNLVFLWREMSGEKKNSESGDVQKFARGIFDYAKGRSDAEAGVQSGPGVTNRAGLLADMFTNKENPILATGTRILQGKDRGGNPINPLTEIAKLAVPLPVTGTYETIKDTGSIPKGIAMNSPDLLGISAQTYGATASKDQGKVMANGKPEFKGKITPDMVLGLDGKPLMDENGRLIKATFPKDATDLEKQAILDEKRKSALGDAYKRTLPKEDQALMKLSDEQLKKYVKDGKITQDRFDQIKNYQKTAESQGKANEYTVPDGVKSDVAKTFYSHWNSMDKKDQEAWLQQAPDDNANAIAGALNKERVSGLDEFKPSNALSKAYAEYENDINTHPEYTEVDKRNKAKAFQKFAYQLNYSTPQKDIYNEGPSSDLKYLLEQGQVSREDLNAAVHMDDQLYSSGLTGSLKFNKKFRNQFGYSIPSGSGSGGSGGGRGGSSSVSKIAMKTGIDSLLPGRSSLSQGGVLPTFSTTPRKTKLNTANVSTPKTSNNRKISIKL